MRHLATPTARYAKPPVPRAPPGCHEPRGAKRLVIHTGPVASAAFHALKGHWIEPALFLAGVSAVLVFVLVGVPYAAAKFQAGQSYCGAIMELPESVCDSVRCMERDAALIKMEIDRMKRCG